ncbi:MAG: helix-turn-helix domain-containing protein [Candidatus Dormibacteria bacterium]
MEFNPSRLELARKRRGLTKTDLAGRTGLSIRTLVLYEKGFRVPSARARGALAEVLGFSPAFFEGPDLDGPVAAGTSFRAIATLSARERDQAMGSATFALALADWIDEHFSLPVVDVPDLRGADPEVAAESIRRSWGLGERSVTNMIHVLEAHGVRVFSLSHDSSNLDAFSFWRSGVPYVFLNTMKSGERSRMDAAHELGHLVLHASYVPQGREVEREAQAFGAAFLMPRASVIAESPRTRRIDHLILAKRRWKVSLAGLAYRMHQVGVLSEWHYRSIFLDLTQLGFHKHEPEPIARETSKMLDKVFRSVRDEGVALPDLAHELTIPTAELNEVVFGLVLTPLSGNAHAPARSWRESTPDLRVV